MLSTAVIIVGDNPSKVREAIDQKLMEAGVGVSEKSSDYMELELDGRHIGIDAVRTGMKFLSKKSMRAKKKVLLIKEADKLTPDAQNALLKTLEEPQSTSMIILVTDMPDSLLPTVVSRCTKVIIKDEFSPDSAFLPIAEKFVGSRVGERLAIIEENKGLFADRTQTLKFLDHVGFVVRKNLTKDKVDFAKKLIKIQKDIAQTNVSTRLAVEYLALA